MIDLLFSSKQMKNKPLGLLKITNDNVDKFDHVEFTYNVMKYITGHALTKQQAIERYLKFTDEPYLGNYFVVFEDTGQIVGFAKIAEDGDDTIEIGYSLFEEFWGNGLGTDLAKLLIEFSKKHFNPKIISGYVNHQNLASQRVIEKAGLQKVAEKIYANGELNFVYQINLSI
jgi:[ribosomal protein S5]-alanine N-acetyltransferase